MIKIHNETKLSEEQIIEIWGYLFGILTTTMPIPAYISVTESNKLLRFYFVFKDSINTNFCYQNGLEDFKVEINDFGIMNNELTTTYKFELHSKRQTIKFFNQINGRLKDNKMTKHIELLSYKNIL